MAGAVLRRSVPAHALSALGWAVGVGIGVALGGYLTAVSGAGAPGSASLDASELFFLPMLAAVGVFVVLFAGGVLVSGLARVLHSRDPH